MRAHVALCRFGQDRDRSKGCVRNPLAQDTSGRVSEKCMHCVVIADCSPPVVPLRISGNRRIVQLCRATCARGSDRGGPVLPQNQGAKRPKEGLRCKSNQERTGAIGAPPKPQDRGTGPLAAPSVGTNLLASIPPVTAPNSQVFSRRDEFSNQRKTGYFLVAGCGCV